MSKIVYKYPISPGLFSLSLPKGFWPLHVGTQQGVNAVLWALVEKEDELAPFEFYSAMTGELLPEGEWVHIGTTTVESGIVLHLFMKPAAAEFPPPRSLREGFLELEEQVMTGTLPTRKELREFLAKYGFSKAKDQYKLFP